MRSKTLFLACKFKRQLSYGVSFYANNEIRNFYISRRAHKFNSINNVSVNKLQFTFFLFLIRDTKKHFLTSVSKLIFYGSIKTAAPRFCLSKVKTFAYETFIFSQESLYRFPFAYRTFPVTHIRTPPRRIDIFWHTKGTSF